MELLEGIETRRSFRAFKPAEVPREIIERILQTAGKSPSYKNTQPWEVAVVRGKKKDELSGILYEMARADTAPSPDLPLPGDWPPELEKRLQEHGARRFKALGIERGDAQKRKEFRLQNFRFYGAPCVLFLLVDSMLTSWSILDMGLFAQSLVLAAHSFGLGCCLQESIVTYPDAVRAFLKIPKTRLLVLGISVGYPDLEAAVNAYHGIKVSPDEFTHWYE